MERRLEIRSDSANLSIEKHFYYPSQNPHSYFYRKDVRDAILKFEINLLAAGYTVHYSQNAPNIGSKPNDKIFMDSLLAMRKNIDLFVLLSTQGEHASILRRFKNSCIKSILIGWNATCTNSYGESRCWKTDAYLINNANIYCPLDRVLNKPNGKHPLVEIMFERSSPRYPSDLQCG
jgi:hypothetical protein